jgi:hypothetical protein
MLKSCQGIVLLLLEIFCFVHEKPASYCNFALYQTELLLHYKLRATVLICFTVAVALLFLTDDTVTDTDCTKNPL